MGFFFFVFHFVREFSLLKICCAILWTPKPLLRSEYNTCAVPAPQSPAVRIANDATFQQSSDPVKG